MSTLAAARRSRPVASLAGSSRTAATPGTVFDTLRAALSRADVPEADRQLFGIVFDELLRRAPLDQARLRETTVAIRVRSVGRLPVTVTNRDLMTVMGRQLAP